MAWRQSGTSRSPAPVLTKTISAEYWIQGQIMGTVLEPDQHNNYSWC